MMMIETGGTCRAEWRVKEKRANLRLIQFVAQLIFIIAVVLAERQRKEKSSRQNEKSRMQKSATRKETTRQHTHSLPAQDLNYQE